MKCSGCGFETLDKQPKNCGRCGEPFPIPASTAPPQDGANPPQNKDQSMEGNQIINDKHGTCSKAEKTIPEILDSRIKEIPGYDNEHGSRKEVGGIDGAGSIAKEVPSASPPQENSSQPLAEKTPEPTLLVGIKVAPITNKRDADKGVSRETGMASIGKEHTASLISSLPTEPLAAAQNQGKSRDIISDTTRNAAPKGDAVKSIIQPGNATPTKDTKHVSDSDYRPGRLKKTEEPDNINSQIKQGIGSSVDALGYNTEDSTYIPPTKPRATSKRASEKTPKPHDGNTHRSNEDPATSSADSDKSLKQKETRAGNVASGSSYSKPQEQLDGRDDPTAFISVYFHVIVSKDFNVNPEKDKVIVRAGNIRGFKDWEDTVCEMHVSREFKDLGSLYDGFARIPAECMDTYIPYKYVVIRKKGNEEYEHIYTSNMQNQTQINRCLHMQARYIRDEWHQYDDVCTKEVQQGVWQRVTDLIPLWKSETIQKQVCRVMLSSIFSLLKNVDDHNLKNFFNQLEQFWAVYKEPQLCVGDTVLPADHRVDREEIISLILEETCEKLLPKKSQENIDGHTRLKMGLTSLRVIHQHRIPVTKELCESLCHALCLEGKATGAMAADLRAAQTMFSAYDSMGAALIQLCNQCILYKADCWVWVLPVLHAFSTKQESPQCEKENVWAGLQWLPHKTQARSLTLLFSRSLFTKMKEKRHLLEAHRMVPRSWLCLTPTNHMEAFLKEFKEVQIVDALKACCFKFSGAKPEQIQKVKAILERLLHMMDQQSRSLDGELFKEYSRASVGLYKSICQNKILKPHPEIIYLSANIVLTVVRGAEQSNRDHVPKTKPLPAEIESTLRDGMSLTLEWMEDVCNHNFNWKKKNAFLTELEIWNEIIKIGEGWKAWKDPFLNSLQGKIQREVPFTQIKIYYENYDLFKDLQAYIGKCFEDCAFEAVPLVGKNDILSLIGSDNFKHFGRFVSCVIEHSWPRDRGGKHVTDKRSVLRHLLEWPGARHLFTFHGSDSGVLLEFTEEVRKLVSLLVSVLLGTLIDVADGNIAFEDMERILQNKKQLLTICDLQTGEKANADILLTWRKRELDTFRREREWVDSLLKRVLNLRQTLKVNISDIQKKHREELGPKMIKDIFAVRRSEEDQGGFGSAMSYYNLDPSLMNMAEHLHLLSNSYVFVTCWEEQAKTPQQIPESGQCSGDLDFTIEDVYDGVFTPSVDQCKTIYRRLKSGEVTFEAVDTFFNIFKDKYAELNSELRVLCCLGDNDDYSWIPERVTQIRQYHRIHVAFSSARLMFKVKLILALSGNFKTLETILQFADGFETCEQKPLSCVNDELMETITLLSEMDDGHIRCLQRFLDCKVFLDWVKETLKDVNELKVFVDLASISAGEDDRDVDRVTCLHDAVLGYSPLLYEVRPDFGFDDLMKCLEKLWKALKSDPNLHEKLGESARQIEWLKTVKESHGSVEMSSLSLATTINKRGVYLIRAPKDNKKITPDSVIQLAVPKSEEGGLDKRYYTLEELKELLNKLMLLSWKGDQRNAEVEKFSQILFNVQRLAKSFIDLYLAGNLLFRTWEATINCSDEASVGILMNFHVVDIDELEGHGVLTDLLPDICRTMETFLEQWLNFVDNKRSQLYYLNYYTAEQLVYLCQQYQGRDISEEALLLLSFIKPNCAKHEAIHSFFISMESDSTSRSPPDMMEFAFDLQESVTVSEKLELIWRLSMDSMSSLFPGCVDLDTLGTSLAALAELNTESVVRDLHPSLQSGHPNLLLCPLSEMLSCSMAIYMHSSGQPLPSYDEVLLCSPDTDFEDVSLFLHRCLIPGYRGSKIYMLIYADQLSYEVAYKSEQLFQKLQAQGMDSYNLVILCNSSQDHRYIPSVFGQFKTHMVPLRPLAEIQHYLCDHFRIGSEVISGAHVFKKGMSAGIVSSKREGVGKSLYVKRLYQKLTSTFPNEEPRLKIIRLTKPEVDENKVLESLLTQLDERTKKRPMIFHIDITYSVISGISDFLFKLLVLRYLKGSKGRVWKCQPSHLYIIEILECSGVQFKPVHQSGVIDFFPKISCCPPKEIMTRTSPPNATDCEDPGMDIEEFRSECFQRPYQYLIRFQRGDNLDTFTYSKGRVEEDPAGCLQIFLLCCGIGDPSWSELRNFAWFLNLQLKDCEESVFCNQTYVGDILRGFKNFVVKFMILMAKDFATPSLHITDQSVERQEIKEQDLLPFLIRKRWESEPHPYIFFNDDHQSMNFIGLHLQPNRSGSIDAINPKDKSIIQQNIMSRQLYKGLELQGVPFNEDFDQLPRDEKIKRLCMVLGIKKVVDPDDTYELTMDNVLKILAIKMRFRCGIPVVIMGETGCGKTRLIKFLCHLCKGSIETENMKLVKVHGGTTAENIYQSIVDAQKIAQENMKQGCETVLFFDEANTTEAISSIKEALCDHSIEGASLEKDSGLQIIAACNPYRKHLDDMIKRLESAGLGYRVRADETKERLGSIPLRQLVYRVHALPRSIMPLVWDFGQLNNDVEKKYIQQIVKHFAKDKPISDSDIRLLTDVLSASQSYMRTKRDECSFVSLRDVERCIEVFRWFFDRHQNLLKHQRSMLQRDLSSYNERDKSASCLVLAIGVCYHASLEKKDAYREEICQIFPQPYNDPKSFLDEINYMQELFLAGVRLRDTIAKNLALKENLFMMVICIELKIPLFVVGKPGSSKSLAKTIVADAMQGQASHTALYKDLKQIHLVSFQCSPHSTAEGIIGTFKHCAQFQKGKNLNEYVSVVVLDEIGLAEDSPKMPLKTLHPLLEDGCLDDDKSPHRKVGFIGISNWALDPAKMNRGIFVSREDPSEDELIKSAEGICSSDLLTQTKVSQHFSNFAKAYIELCKTQEEFFGLRDFYSLIKMVFAFTKQSTENLSSEKTARAVLRNFSGKDHVNALDVFLTEEQPNVAEIRTIDLVMENINSDSDDCRYLLLLTKNSAALQILQQVLLKADKQPEIIFGSSFPKDQEYTQICRNINRVKICMETGQMVILLNLQSLYESLYDALNQYYVYLAGQKYVDLGLGTHRVKCRVHPKFRLIVIEEKEVVYKEFPIPLINRLEKHYLDINSCLEKDHKDIVHNLEAWISKFTKHNPQDTYSPADVFIGYHSDTCASVVLQVTENIKQLPDEGENMENVENQAIKILLNCATPDSVIRCGNKEYLSDYFKKQKHGCLIDLLCCHVTTGCDRPTMFTEITTFSRLLTSADQKDLEAALQSHIGSIGIVSLQQFDTEFSFLNKIRSFLEHLSGILILIIQTEFEEGSHGPNLVASAKYSAVSEINKMTLQKASVFVYFITKLPRMKGGTSYVGFRGGLWRSIHIDDLREPNDMVPDVTAFEGVTISQLFFTEESKEPVKDEETNFDLANNAESERGDTSEDKDMDTESSQARPEDLLNTSILIRSCIQKAISLLSDDAECRSTKRIDVMINLLRQDNQLKRSFYKTLKLRLYKMLKMAEEVMFDPSRWVVRVAESQDTLQEAGTFRQSVWTRVQRAVTPILSQILSVVDCNANLDLLVCDSQDDFVKSLWLYIFQNENFLPISYNPSENMRANYMNNTFCKKNHLPFSWRIKDYLEEIWTQAQNIDSRAGPAIKFLDIFSNSPLGKYISNQEPKKMHDLFQRYTKDFIQMTMSISSDKELQVMEFALTAVIEETRTSRKAKEPLHLPWVHIGYNQFQHRLQNLKRIVHIDPSVLDSLIQKNKNPTKIKEMVLDIYAARTSLEQLNVRISDPHDWMQKIKAIQVPIEVICSEEYLQGCSAFCKPVIKQIRSRWNCAFSTALFLQHLLVEENLRDECLRGLITGSAEHIGKSLRTFPDMKSETSLRTVVNILQLFREEVAKSTLSDSKKNNLRKQCNAFFADILCNQCYKGSTPPDDDVIRHLLRFLFGSNESGASNQSRSPFKDAVDETPVIRSVILKLLLKYSFGPTMKHIQEYLEKVKSKPEDTTELYLLIINCLEDVLFENKPKNLNEKEKDRYFTDEIEFLQNCLLNTKDRVQNQLPVMLLQDVARVRLALDTAVEMLSEKPREIKHEDFLKSVMDLCSESGNDWYRVYFIRKLVHLDGIDAVQRHLKDPQSKWMFPWDGEASRMDHYLVYGQSYKTLKVSVARALIDRNPQLVATAIQESRLQNKELSVVLILSAFREITLYYGLQKAQQGASSEQAPIKSHIREVRIFQEESLKQFVETLLNNDRPFLRAAPDMTASRVTIVELAAHLAAVILSGNNGLFSPLKNLSFSPSTMQNSYLPSMPEDMLSYVRSAMTERVQWYACSNNHYYSIGNCGRPAVIMECTVCKEKIGGENHNLLEGNVDLKDHKDTTETGHVLGAPESQVQPKTVDRDIALPAFILLRMITHLAMLLGSEQDAQSVKLIVKPEVPDVQSFLSRHIERDGEFLQASLGTSADDTTSVVHLILHQMCTLMLSGQEIENVDAFWSKKEARNSWEKEFASKVIAPVLEDLDKRLKTAKHHITQDEKISSNPVAMVVYRDPSESESRLDLPQDSQVHCSKVWACRVRVSVEYLLHVVQQKNGKVTLPLLWKFLEKEAELQLVRFLPGILKLQKELLKKFQNFKDIGQKTIGDALQSINPVGVQSVFKKQIEEYISVWNGLRLSLKTNGEIKLPEDVCDEILTLDSGLELLLPRRQGRGLAATALTSYLIALHNSFIYALEDNSQPEHRYSVTASEVTDLHVISFEMERDVWPIVLFNCRYSLGPDNETLQEFDFSEIQRHIGIRLFQGKPVITLQGLPTLSLTKDRNYENLFMDVKKRIPQESLSHSAIDVICRDLNEFNDVSEAFDMVDLSLGFLATSGGDAEVSLAKYVEDDLQMGEQSSKHVLEALRRYDLRHSVALWQLLGALKSQHLVHLKRDPFADVNDAYKQALDADRQRALAAFLEKYGTVLFRLELHEIIMLKLRTPESTGVYKPAWILKDVMGPILDVKEVSIPELEGHFPEELAMAHCVEVWKAAAAKRWKK